MGDFFWTDKLRDVADPAIFVRIFFECSVNHWRVSVAWADAVDYNSVARMVDRHRLREKNHTRFGGAVGSRIGCSNDTPVRRDIRYDATICTTPLSGVKYFTEQE